MIAAPIATRDANLTVRQIGASILDLTLHTPSNDQLSAYIPTAARYLFHDPSLVRVGEEGDTVFWSCRSSKNAAGDGTTATVTYRLREGEAFVEATVTIEGQGSEAVKSFDGVRADKTFRMDRNDDFAYCEDEFFRQTIGFVSSGGAPTWKQGRPAELHYGADQVATGSGTKSWTVRLYPATSLLDLQGALQNATMREFQFSDSLPDFDGESVTRATLSFQAQGAETSGSVRTDDQGHAHVRLPDGPYRLTAKIIGLQPLSIDFDLVAEDRKLPVRTSNGGGFIADVTDGSRPIPAKATIYAIDGKDPDFGPDSTRTFVKNCVYSVSGRFRCRLEPGRYEVYFSRGPEYNREVRTIEVSGGAWPELGVMLSRVVDTGGWVSTELHSHSSPSGDNVSDQFGRVENLLCEHLEFAPCTEHNRISSYEPHLKRMGRSHWMATCSGIELTGRPLPVNHQNAFPLHHHPHTQNGGGPRVDVNPVVQIERIAMWDGGSDKLIQQNHPNLHQIYGDLDVDGRPDEGFRGMLRWMDVIEVHPPQTIFEDVAVNPPNVREMRIPMFQWIQLLNQGIRIPGVVNTDAHYNHHGSGWLRNWFASSTDNPAEISTDEMVREAEAGHIIMSTGPFLNVTATSSASDRAAIPGDDLSTSDGKVRVKVRVQCPNWLDVNRVQVFVNGRPREDLNRTRKSHPKLFGSAKKVVKFDATFDVALDDDAHLIVATIGEGMTMQKVMSESYGNRPPIAVSNPIFVDTDGDGFTPNGDGLGLPLPGH